MQARRSAALVLLILLLDERARASLSGTSPSPVAGARQGPGAAAQLRQPAGAQLGRWRGGLWLRLRGGVFYDPDEGADNDEDEDEWEDEDGSYYETTEEEGDAFDQQAAGGVFAQRVFELPDGTRVDVGDETIPTRYGEGMTAEQALADSEHIPAVGTFSGGCDRDIAEIMLASARVRWVDGAPPAGEQVPLRLRDVYGLGEYVKLAPEDDAERGRRFEPELDQANDPRSLLKVPPEELPDLFHMPCGEDPNGGDDAQTLATRFGNYYGPAPESFSGYVRTPKGRVFVHSWPEPQFETESPEMLLNVSDENGLPIIASPEALAFFHVSVQPHGPTALHPPHSPHRTPVPPPPPSPSRRPTTASSEWCSCPQAATAKNLESGATVPDDIDGTYEPGPVSWAQDVMCGLSCYSLAQVRQHARSGLPEIVVPSPTYPRLYEVSYFRQRLDSISSF